MHFGFLIVEEGTVERTNLNVESIWENWDFEAQWARCKKKEDANESLSKSKSVFSVGKAEIMAR